MKTINKKKKLCDYCGEVVEKGATIYIDKYRDNQLCDNCINEYEKEIATEEGEDGRLLK